MCDIKQREVKDLWLSHTGREKEKPDGCRGQRKEKKKVKTEIRLSVKNSLETSGIIKSNERIKRNGKMC